MVEEHNEKESWNQAEQSSKGACLDEFDRSHEKIKEDLLPVPGTLIGEFAPFVFQKVMYWMVEIFIW